MAENTNKAKDLPNTAQPGDAARAWPSLCLIAKAFDLEIRHSTHHHYEKYHTWSILQATFQYLKEEIF